MTDDEISMTSVEYERLTRDLVKRISRRAIVTTMRLEHNVQLSGRATSQGVGMA